MIFLDPTSDIGFKKLFANAAHKDIVISFLNSVLGRVEGEKIVDVEINDPHNLPKVLKLKSSIVDVRCSDQKGKQYIVKIQAKQQTFYAANSIRPELVEGYYSAIALGEQLAHKENYKQLLPVIFIGVLDFVLFNNNPHYISHHFILDSETHAHELTHLEFHFIELKKFNKKENELDTILDKWIYLLNEAEKLEEIPKTLQNPEFDDAFQLLSRSNWSKAELTAYERYKDDIRSHEGQLDFAEQKGKMEGKLEGKLEVAKQLLDILDVETIAKKTGLSIKQIKDLKKESKE